MKIMRSRFKVLVLFSLLLVQCGGGIDEGGEGEAYNPVWVSIDPLSSIVNTASVSLYGKAYCDVCPPRAYGDYQSCPDLKCPQNSSVSVVWHNRSSGVSGSASYGISRHCGPSFPGFSSPCVCSCKFGWSASVPLVAGGNIIKIVAIDGSGRSGTDSVTVTYDNMPPSEPTNLSVNAVSSTQIDLSWSASIDNVGVAGYKIYRDGAYIATLLASTSYSNIGLTSATQYCYTISAYDTMGNQSTQSSQVCAVTFP